MSKSDVSVNIQSNMLRGDYMRGIVDRTITEIHDDLVTVFGPLATDAYLTRDGNPYYTRDGKETVRSMQFDNALSQYVLAILYQAINDQAEQVGDGTTTMGVFYTNLYRTIRQYQEKRDAYNMPSRKVWERVVNQVNAAINGRKTDMQEDDLIQMLFTCTQDAELSSKIYHNLKDAIMNNAYVVINKADIASDFNVTTHANPLIRAFRQFSIFPISGTVNNCTILHCNGVLDIRHPEVLLDLVSRVEQRERGVYVPRTIIILCNGTTEGTRQALKLVVSRMNSLKNQGIDISTYNNLGIYTLRDYRSYGPEELEDLSTIITDEPGIGGLVNQLTFESLLYQAIRDDIDTSALPEESDAEDNPLLELLRFDSDIRHVVRIREMLADMYTVEFDDVEGIRIKKPLGPIALARYNELRKQIETEQVAIKRVDLNQRLRTMYGQFIEVEVGSRLLKDSQRKYELILDAVLAAGQGVEHGVLRANSILSAILAIADVQLDIQHRLEADDCTLADCTCIDILMTAMIHTVIDLCSDKYNLPDGVSTETYVLSAVLNGRTEEFDLTVDGCFIDALPPMNSEQHNGRAHHRVTVTDSNGGEETVEFVENIIEPVSVITTILKNSTMMLELATARTFHLNAFCNNYID